MELFKRIRAMRKDLNMSQDELAKEVGYTSRSTIAKIESGENDIPQSKIKDFARALQTTPAELMGWENKLNEWDEKYNKNGALMKEVKQIAKFEDYLKSLGYKVNVDVTGEWTISKGNITATFTNEEFDKLKEMNATLLDSEIYKNSLKNYVPETIAAHRTDDCTQAIDESTLTNSVQRLKNQAFEKHGVKYK